MRYNNEERSSKCPIGARALATAFATLLLITLFQDITASAQLAERGTEFRFGPSNLGIMDGDVPTQANVLWSFQAERKVESSPVAANNLIYFGSADGRLYALDPLTGKEVWNFTIEGEFTATPTVIGTTIYIGGSDMRFYAIDALSGQCLWNITLPGDMARIATSAKVRGDKAYIGDLSGKFHAINLTTREIDWSFDAGDHEIWSTPALDGPYVYFGTAYSKGTTASFFCLDAEKGTLEWKHDVKGVEGIFASPLVVDGKVIISTGIGDETTYCFNGTDGSVIWSFYAAGPIYGSAAVHGDRVFLHIWVSNNPDIVRPSYLLTVPLEEPAPMDGNMSFDDVIWQAETDEGQGGSSPLVSGGRVVVGSANGHLWCFNETDGSVVWDLKTASGIVSSPVVFNHVVYVGSNDGMVFAISGSGASTVLEIMPESPTVKGNRVLGIRFRVSYRGVPLKAALVKVSASQGKMSQDSATTFPDGTQRFKLVAPDVSSDTMVTISANVSKLGFPSVDNSTNITVVKGTSYTNVQSGELHLSLATYLWQLVAIAIIVVLNIIVFILTQRKKKGPRQKKEKEKKKDEGAGASGPPAAPAPPAQQPPQRPTPQSPQQPLAPQPVPPAAPTPQAPPPEEDDGTIVMGKVDVGSDDPMDDVVVVQAAPKDVDGGGGAP